MKNSFLKLNRVSTFSGKGQIDIFNKGKVHILASYLAMGGGELPTLPRVLLKE
jgi:hypothetical protein